MFTGIVQGIGRIELIVRKKNFCQWIVSTNSLMVKNLEKGSSIACNGCCLTVCNIKDINVYFDIIKETLKSTNLGFLRIGQYVNLERSIKYGEEIGGHFTSGHIITTAVICNVISSNFNKILWFELNELCYLKYIFYKGFICIDGISLTVGSIINNRFCISLIPETILRTTINKKICGDSVNIELDFYTQIIVGTVERLFSTKYSR